MPEVSNQPHSDTALDAGITHEQSISPPAVKSPSEIKSSAIEKPSWISAKIVIGVVIALGLVVFFTRNLILGTPVEAHMAVLSNLRQSVVASGRVIWPQRIDIAAELLGRVNQIPVIEGQQVRKGQLLIQLENKDEEASLGVAIAAVTQAQASVQQQREVALPTARQNVFQAQADATQINKHFNRMQKLSTQHFVSDSELEAAGLDKVIAQSKLTSAQLQEKNNLADGSEAALVQTALNQAQASLQLAQIKLAQDSIGAPADGTLISRSVEPGDIVQAGKVLMVLAAQGETQLEVQIDEKNLAKLAIGQNALGSADAFASQHFAAEIIYINPGIDASRGSVEIKLRVQNPPAYLRQDMTVSVDIETATRSNTLVIPTAALRDSSSENPWVLVVRDHHTFHQNVKIGLRGDNNLEVLSGIAQGEAVIFPSLGLIKAGQHVRVTLAKPI